MRLKDLCATTDADITFMIYISNFRQISGFALSGVIDCFG